MKKHDELGSSLDQIRADIAYDLTINGTTNEFLSVAARKWHEQTKN